MIYIGIDDTDIVGTPGTNQLARAILKRLGSLAAGAVICRHQLFFDPRVPYTSKNGSASLQLPAASEASVADLIEIARDVMKAWYVEGSDPGLCVTCRSTSDMAAFAARAKTEVVTQGEAREVAARAGAHLEGLGGTGQGIIGALSAVPLAAGGDDGRVVHLAAWPYPDELGGVQDVDAIARRGVQEIRELASGRPFQGRTVDIGRHLRPNWRHGRVVLFVEPPAEETSPWRAVKLL